MTGLELLPAGPYVHSPLSVAVLGTSVVVAALGVYPLVRREALQESLFFFLLCLAIAIWLFGFGWTYASTDPDRAMRWIRLAYLGIPLIPAALFTVAVHTLGVADRRRWHLGVLWFGAAVFVVLSVGTDVVITGVRRFSWGYYPQYAPAGGVFVVFVAAGIGASLREYWRRYREARRPEERARARLYLLAFGAGSMAVLDFLPCYGIDVYPGGYLAILLMAILMGYTLRGYRLTELTPAFAAGRILSTIGDPVLVCDREGRIRLVNEAVTAILGYPEDELLGGRFRRLIRDGSGGPSAWSEVLERESLTDEELILVDREDRSVPVSISSSAVRDSDGRRVGTAVVARDIRDRKELEEQLRHQALHDPLTGLANRALFEDRLRQMLRMERRREEGEVGVLYLDLDRFKTINDTYGHPAGDEVLQEVAGRLQEAVREADTVARLGGDEFAVALGALDDDAPVEEGRRVGRRVVEAVGEPLPVDGGEFTLSCSVGLATSGGDDGLGAGELIRRADLAMYHVKSGLHGQVGTFEPRLKEAADRRLRIERDLEGAAAREELRLVYHPVMDLVAGGVAALEALLRWEHPELGRLGPGEFIRLAEETGEIVPFGRWTLREACRQMRRWREAIPGGGDLRIMVNVSEAEITDGEYAGTVRDALSETGLPPDALELEVTERMVTGDTETLDDTLQAIRKLGVHVSVDDFGTGTSSLQMVRRLHLDGLKIDRSFVHRVAQDDRGRRFIRSILDLARDLDLTVIAEGVEEADDLGILREMEIDRAQGFLWTEPLSATEVPDFLTGPGASAGGGPPWAS